MALIELNNMSFYGFHGCFEEERLIGTNFRVDFRFETNTERAEESDNIEDTISYLDVYQTIKRVFEEPVNLLEFIARKILETCFQEYPSIENAEVKVSKLNPPLGGKLEGVSITLGRSRAASK